LGTFPTEEEAARYSKNFFEVMLEGYNIFSLNILCSPDLVTVNSSSHQESDLDGIHCGKEKETWVTNSGMNSTWSFVNVINP
jgi:hypothetical protein